MSLLGIMGDDMDFASPLKFVKISSTLQDSIGVNERSCWTQDRTKLSFLEN